MLIPSAIVQDSIARYKTSPFKPKDLSRRIGDGDRSRFVTQRQKRERYRTLLSESGDASQAHEALERLIGGNDLVGINYLELGYRAARSVCRVHLRDGNGNSVGFGTGFLVAPGVVMTNHHVISSAADARNALAEFDYELDSTGHERPVAAFQIDEHDLIAHQPLDFCLVRVSDHGSLHNRLLQEYGWLTLSATPGKAFVGEYLTIIQHPGGERKQVCVRENKLLKYDENAPTLWYETDTVAGSSGSPVFNQSWQVVAIHHSGVPKTDAQGHWLTVDGQVWDQSMDESRVQWMANEGMRISGILGFLKSNYADHPIAKVVLQAPDAVGVTTAPSGNGEAYRSESRDGELHLTIPVHIALRVGDRPALVAHARTATAGNAAVATAPVPSPARLLVPSVDGMESVSVDQSNYGQRTGYQKGFLGSGLTVPLPVITTGKSDVVKFTAGGKQTAELKYWDYSVTMHRQRRLAIFSAVNVDASLRPSNAGRDGDRWYTDTRIKDELQIGSEFYGEQSTFEAERSKNPFDRGHLTRRLDAQWGQTAATAKRNGDDSFHWTNCSPQHWQFNQGSKRWLGLEDYVISTFAGGKRACVFNGPVFDAPLSTLGPGGRVVPTISGHGHADPTFGGVSIPKLFYKIVACRRSNGHLAAAAFLMSQEDLLMRTKRIKGMPALKDEKLTAGEARLFQVGVADIEALTGLDFGPLGAADSGAQELAGRAAPRPIDQLEDMRLA